MNSLPPSGGPDVMSEQSDVSVHTDAWRLDPTDVIHSSGDVDGGVILSV